MSGRCFTQLLPPLTLIVNVRLQDGTDSRHSNVLLALAALGYWNNFLSVRPCIMFEALGTCRFNAIIFTSSRRARKTLRIALATI